MLPSPRRQPCNIEKGYEALEKNKIKPLKMKAMLLISKYLGICNNETMIHLSEEKN